MWTPSRPPSRWERRSSHSKFECRHRQVARWFEIETEILVPCWHHFTGVYYTAVDQNRLVDIRMVVAVVTVLSLEIIVPPRFEIDGKDEARAPPSVHVYACVEQAAVRPPIEQTIQLECAN